MGDVQRIPVDEARDLAKKYGAERLVILAVSGDTFNATSYGKDRATCRAVGRWVDSRAGYVAREISEARALSGDR